MAVTVTYTWPVAGATAPTAAQAANFTSLNATVASTADADTTATITHNWGLTSAQIAAGFPRISPVALGITALLANWIVSSVTANTVVLTKTTTAGSGAAGAQLQVSLERPHTLIQ